MSKIPETELQEWQKYLTSNIDIPAKDDDLEQNAREITIDLHLYNLDEAYQKIMNVFSYAAQHKIKLIKIITGKSGILHSTVPKWLDSPNFKNTIKSYNLEKHNSGCLCVSIK